MKRTLTLIALLATVVASVGQELIIVPPVPWDYVPLQYSLPQADPSLVTSNVWWTTNSGANTLTNTASLFNFTGIGVQSPTNITLTWSFTDHTPEFGNPAYLFLQYSTNGFNLPPPPPFYSGQSANNYYHYCQGSSEHGTNFTAVGVNGASTWNTTYTDASNTLWINYTNYVGGSNASTWPTSQSVSSPAVGSNIVCWRLVALFNDPRTNNTQQISFAPLLSIMGCSLSATAQPYGDVASWTVQSNTNLYPIDHFKLEYTYDNPATTNSGWTLINSNLAGTARSYTNFSAATSASFRLTQYLTNGVAVNYNVASCGAPAHSQGDIAWSTIISTANLVQMQGVGVVKKDNSVLASGWYVPGPGGTAHYTPSASVSNLNASGNYMFWVKYDSNGFYQWSRELPGAYGKLYAIGLGGDSDGNVTVAGNWGGAFIDFGSGYPSNSVGVYDGFIASYTSSNTFRWMKTIITGAYAYTDTLTEDSSGNVIVSGRIPYPSTGNIAGYTNLPWGAFMVKFAKADGHVLWAKSITSPGGVKASSVACDGSDNIFTAGFLGGTASFDGTSTTNGGIFLAKYTSAGALSWVKSFGNPATTFNNYQLAAGGFAGVDSGGISYLCGGYLTNIDVGGGLLQNPWGGGAGNYPGGGFFLSSYDASGNYRWGHTASGEISFSRSTCVDSGSNAFIDLYVGGVYNDLTWDANYIFPGGNFCLKYQSDATFVAPPIADGATQPMFNGTKLDGLDRIVQGAEINNSQGAVRVVWTK